MADLTQLKELYKKVTDARGDYPGPEVSLAIAYLIVEINKLLLAGVNEAKIREVVQPMHTLPAGRLNKFFGRTGATQLQDAQTLIASSGAAVVADVQDPFENKDDRRPLNPGNQADVNQNLGDQAEAGAAESKHDEGAQGDQRALGDEGAQGDVNNRGRRGEGDQGDQGDQGAVNNRGRRGQGNQGAQNVANQKPRGQGQQYGPASVAATQQAVKEYYATLKPIPSAASRAKDKAEDPTVKLDSNYKPQPAAEQGKQLMAMMFPGTAPPKVQAPRQSMAMR